MNHVVLFAKDALCYRFEAERGVIWVTVYPEGPTTARFNWMEEGVIAAGVGLSDDEAFMSTPEADEARNKFGYSVVREIWRTLQDSLPGVTFRYERKSGANAGREVVRA